MAPVNFSNATESLVTVWPDDRLSYILALLLVCLSSVTVNVFSVAVFTRNRVLHTANNTLVAGLCISDLLSVMTTCLTSLLATAGLDFCLPICFCKLVGYILHVFHTVSINNCVLISFHRFTSVVYPQKKIMNTRRSAQKVLAFLWMLSALICLPGLFTPLSYHFYPVLATCTPLGYTDGDPIFGLYFFTINFLLPSSLMIGFYLPIYREVLNHKISIVDPVSSSTLEKKTRYLMIAILAVFYFAWIPYNALLLLPSWLDITINAGLYRIVWILMLMGTVIHPIVYAVCNRLYCRCMVRLLQCSNPLGYRGSSHSNAKLPPMYTNSKGGDGEIAIISYPSKHKGLSKVRVRTDTEQTMLSPVKHLPDVSSRNAVFADRYNSKISSWSQNTDISTCSSVPTILRFPRRNCRPSSVSQMSYNAFGPTPQESLSSAYGSSRDRYSTVTSVSMYAPSQGSSPSARTSLISQNFSQYTPQSARSSFVRFSDTPHRLSHKRSYGRSARSSVSSRFSAQYTPISTPIYPPSSRSSLISNFTPFSSRASTPFSHDSGLASNGDGDEYIFIGSPVEGMPEKGASRHFRHYGRGPYLPIPEEKFEDTYRTASGCEFPYINYDGTPTHRSPIKTPTDMKPSSNLSSPKTVKNDSQLAHEEWLQSARCMQHRISSVMFGDIELVDDPASYADIDSDEEDETANDLPWEKARKMSEMNIKVRRAVGALSRLNSDTGVDNWSPRPSPPGISRASPTYCLRPSSGLSIIHEQDSPEKPEECLESDAKKTKTDRFAMHQAAQFVVKAKRLRCRLQKCRVVPFHMEEADDEFTIPAFFLSATPSPPVSPCQKTVPADTFSFPGECMPSVPSPTTPSSAQSSAPARYVYEKPLPNFTYVQRPMTHLRVPGRQPALNVPQTIIEEDLPCETLTPESPHPKRKNASTWIAPPVIDIGELEDTEEGGMRVATPGVLVEHHH